MKILKRKEKKKVNFTFSYCFYNFFHLMQHTYDFYTGINESLVHLEWTSFIINRVDIGDIHF